MAPQDMNYISLGLASSLEENSAPKRRWQIEISYFSRLP